jgi:hypothetical protein
MNRRAQLVLRFDNASATERLRFVAYYLLVGQQELIEMLLVSR